MEIDAAAERFRDDGFLVVDGFFEAETMRPLDERIAGHFGPAPGYLHDRNFTAGAEVEVVPWFPQRGGVTDFDAIEADAGMAALTDAVLGPGWHPQYCMVMFSADGSAGQAWHQDCPPDDPNRYNLNRLVYPRAVDPLIGGQLVVVPGSHRLGELPSGAPHGSLPNQLTITPGCGSLVFVHGHTWHRVTPVSGAPRCSINFRAGPAGTDPGLTDVCVYRNMRYRFSTGEVLTGR